MIMHSKNEWENLGSQISFKNKAFINGKFVNTISEETFDCLNPSNCKTISIIA